MNQGTGFQGAGVSTQPAKRPNHLTLAGQLCQMGVNCLIDTGATDSIVSASTYERIPAEQRPPLTGETGVYTGVDGQRLRVWGKMEAPLVFEHVRVWQGLVVAEIDGEVILGMDFLQRQQCSLDIVKGVVRVGKEELRCWDQNADNARFRVVTETEVELKPHETRTVIARVQRTGEMTPWAVIEPRVQLSDNPKLMVGRTLVSTSRDEVPVRIHNSGDEPEVLRPKELLGWCQSVQSCGDAQDPPSADPRRQVRNIQAPVDRKQRNDTVLPHMEDLVEHLVRWDLHPETLVTHKFQLEQVAEQQEIHATSIE